MQPIQRRGIADGNPPFPVRDRAVDQIVQPFGEQAAAVGFRLKVDPAAFKMAGVVRRQRHAAIPIRAERRAGQQARFDQNLEAVADAEHRPPAGYKARHVIAQAVLETHGEQRPRAQVVAIGEAARHDQHGIIEQALFAADQLVDVDDLRAAPGQFTGQRRLPIPVRAVGMQDQNARRPHRLDNASVVLLSPRRRRG